MSAAQSNPGSMMASTLDAEIEKLRSLQGEIGKLRSDLHMVVGQKTENEMVAMELDVLAYDSAVYKKIGPILFKQNPTAAKETVRKRLGFIEGEKTRLEAAISTKEKRGEEIAVKVQQMQTRLQQTTAEAVRLIENEHRQTSRV